MKKRPIVRAMPVVAVIVLLAVLCALAFVFGTGGGKVRAEKIDRTAVTALDNARLYAEAHDFSTEMKGTVKARVFGIPYNVEITGERTSENGGYTEYGETRSAFVKAAVTRSVVNGKAEVAKGKYKRGSFVFSAPEKYTKSEYEKMYGKPATGLLKYDYEIISAKCDGDAYVFELDPKKAAANSGNEIKTVLGSKSAPIYESITVTLYTDGERPVKVSVREKFSVEKFGGTHCEMNYEEIFDFKD